MPDQSAQVLSPQEEVPFDPLAPGFSADPYPVFRRIREQDPVHQTSRGFWLITRYDDVLTVLRDPRFGRGRSAEAIRLGWGEGAAAKYISLRLSGYNRPDHTRLRSLVNRAFTGKRVESMRSHIRAIAEELLDRARGASRFNVVQTLTHPLPSLNIVRTKPLKPDLLREPAPDYSFQCPFESWAHLDFAHPMGADHQNRHLWLALCQKAKERQGGIVCPMKIFEN